MNKRQLACYACLLFGSISLAPAATLTVTNLNNAGAGSLRQAIADAATNDTIVFTAGLTGTITLTTGELVINKALTITGPGAEFLTIHGNNASRVLNLNASSAVSVITLSGLKIANGRLGGAGISFGAGLYVTSAGTVNMNECVVTANSIVGAFNPAAGAGIAFDSASGTLNLNACSIDHNTFSSNSGSASNSGAGLANLANGTMNLSGTDVTDNQATAGTQSGAAIYGSGIFNLANGTLNLNTCTVSNNTLTSTASGMTVGGAGLANFASAAVTLRQTIFDNNIATGTADVFGGGLVNLASGPVAINQCNFTSNRATGASSSGGGVAVVGNGGISVNESKFRGNRAQSEFCLGGALVNLAGGTTTVISSEFSGNFAEAATNGRGPSGGAVGNAGGGTLNLTNCTIANNTVNGRASQGGGVINFPNASGPPAVVNTMNLTNCTIAGNTIISTTTAEGGGVYAGAVIFVTNNIVANNTASTGPDVDGSFAAGAATGYNIIGKSDGSAGFTNGTNGNQVGTIATPLNPLLGPLADNGGPTQTMALLNGSPALDKARAAVASDQRGVFRPMDDPAIPPAAGGDNSDIGAFEVDTCGASTTVTNTNDSGPGSLRCALASAFSGSEVDFVLPTPAVITLASTLLVSKSVAIQGPGAGLLTISGNNQNRVFNVLPGNFDVDFSDLTVSAGRITGANGVITRGAGVYNQSSGVVSLTRSTVSGHTITNPTPAGGNVNGAAISHIGGGILNLVSSTISGNLAEGRGFDGVGAGVFADSGVVNIFASTFSGNTASTTNNGNLALGAGLYCIGTCAANVINSTFSGNSTSGQIGGGAGIYATGTGAKSVTNSLSPPTAALPIAAAEFSTIATPPRSSPCATLSSRPTPAAAARKTSAARLFPAALTSSASSAAEAVPPVSPTASTATRSARSPRRSTRSSARWPPTAVPPAPTRCSPAVPRAMAAATPVRSMRLGTFCLTTSAAPATHASSPPRSTSALTKQRRCSSSPPPPARLTAAPGLSISTCR